VTNNELHHGPVETGPKRVTRVAMTVVLLVAVGALGFGVAVASGQLDQHSRTTAQAPADVTTAPIAPPIASPSAPPTPTPTPTPVQIETPTAPVPGDPATSPPPPAQVLAAVVLKPGDNGHQVRVLQSRLRELFWFTGRVTDTYGPQTTAAVKGFQAKRGLPATGTVDTATLERLTSMTHRPTADELANKISDGSWTSAPLDARCRTGRTLCIDKTSRTIRWVVDGTVLKTMAVRFGASYTPTREGLFHVESKSRDHVSSLYGSAMPFAMFFSRGQAVHYSSDFAARGYAGASHGCVNVRDYDGIKALFDEVNVGDKVVVYRS
jgi:peptidoglycan hydrolase-like protein with peptidoglycan-binding domain